MRKRNGSAERHLDRADGLNKNGHRHTGTTALFCEVSDETIPVLIQKNAGQYDSFDLLQNWRNGAEYIFLEAKDVVDELAAFMKANEMSGVKSVYFIFPNDTSDGPQTSNHVAINVSGFSNGFDAFQIACAASQ